MQHDFEEWWGSGEEGSVWTVNDAIGVRNRQVGMTRYVMWAALLDPRMKNSCSNFFPQTDLHMLWLSLERQIKDMAREVDGNVGVHTCEEVDWDDASGDHGEDGE